MLLAVMILGGLLLGVVVARFDAGRPARSRAKRPAAAAARATMVGLTGCGLILAQFLTPARAEWLVVGLAGMTAGAASHAWFKDRQRTM